MTKEKQIEHFEKLCEDLKKILLSKGDDYAGEDRLSNFKFAGAIVGIGARKQCLSMIAVKVARLGNLLDSKQPNNESVQDSILDLIAYGFLLDMIDSDE